MHPNRIGPPRDAGRAWDPVGATTVVGIRAGPLGGGGTRFVVTSNLRGNVVQWNALGLAWQDGADVVLGANDISCNEVDGPLVDGGLTLP